MPSIASSASRRGELPCPPPPQWVFGPFRLDPANACLWCNAEAIVLPPKAFDVLHSLVTHPDRLVSKDELLDAVWPETAVSDAVVRSAIGELRACSQPPQRAVHKGRSVCLNTRHAATLAEPGMRRYPELEDGVFSIFLVECKR